MTRRAVENLFDRVVAHERILVGKGDVAHQLTVLKDLAAHIKATVDRFGSGDPQTPAST